MPLQTTIKIEPKVKFVLDRLKIIPRETYSNVIERLILERFESKLEINDYVKEEISKQMKKLSKGEVKSFEETLEELKNIQKKEAKSGRSGDRNKRNPWESNNRKNASKRS